MIVDSKGDKVLLQILHHFLLPFGKKVCGVIDDAGDVGFNELLARNEAP